MLQSPLVFLYVPRANEVSLFFKRVLLFAYLLALTAFPPTVGLASRLGAAIRDHDRVPVFICLSLRRIRKPVKQPTVGLGLHYPEGLRSLLTPLMRVFDVPAYAVNNQACAGVNWSGN
jgi:hypothetical protein